MCDNLKKDRMRCEACRTINLAGDHRPPKPNMQMYQKCAPVCPKVSELPLNPTCIKVCDIDQLRIKKIIPKKVIPKHGKLMYAVKAGILLGAVYFTYQQGIWGDQVAVVEATRRWREYFKSFHTRRPPVFDECGKVVVGFIPISTFLGLAYRLFLRSMMPWYLEALSCRRWTIPSGDKASWQTSAFSKETTDSIIAPMYGIYKNIITSCFSGFVKFPLIIKCMYLDYMRAMEIKEQELAKSRKLK